MKRSKSTRNVLYSSREKVEGSRPQYTRCIIIPEDTPSHDEPVGTEQKTLQHFEVLPVSRYKILSRELCGVSEKIGRQLCSKEKLMLPALSL